jgi:hypothetical protein
MTFITAGDGKELLRCFFPARDTAIAARGTNRMRKAQR